MPTSTPAAPREAGQAGLQVGGGTAPKQHSVTEHGGHAERQSVNMAEDSSAARWWLRRHIIGLGEGSPGEPRQKAVPGKKHKAHVPQKQALSGILPQRALIQHARGSAQGGCVCSQAWGKGAGRPVVHCSLAGSSTALAEVFGVFVTGDGAAGRGGRFIESVKFQFIHPEPFTESS